MSANLNHRAIVETLESADVLARRLLCHARAAVLDDHPDKLSHRSQVAHAAAIVALLGQALESLELEDGLIDALDPTKG